jgi:hypothetical protein
MLRISFDTKENRSFTKRLNNIYENRIRRDNYVFY